MLAASNVFMTFAWYVHLKNLHSRPWWIAELFSWGIALFEYLLQVPANRIGFSTLSLPQLKILQEVNHPKLKLGAFSPRIGGAYSASNACLADPAINGGACAQPVVITLSVFVPFCVFYMNQPLKLDFLWVGLCLVGAVYFIFRA